METEDDNAPPPASIGEHPQGAAKNQPVPSTQHPDDMIRVFWYKSVHGVPPLWANVSVEKHLPHNRWNAFFYPLWLRLRRARDAPSSGCILTINRALSSLKFALYDFSAEDPLQSPIVGSIERIGRHDASLTVQDRKRGNQQSIPVTASGHGEAAGI